MSDLAPPTTRRERLRAQTLQEIRGHAYDQMLVSGAPAVSLNGIAKAMGMSQPAMYRYVASRDGLLAMLVTESYEDFADALAQAADQTRRRVPQHRLRAVLDAGRQWALAQPHRYRLVFGSTYGTGTLDSERIVPASHRSMQVLVGAIRDAHRPGAPLPKVDAVLRKELIAWSASSGDAEAVDPELLAFCLSTWIRVHGAISIEIEGTFAQMHLDPARLYNAEVDNVVTQLSPA